MMLRRSLPLLLLPLAAHAQAGWPQRPVRLVVPFAPGGSLDVAARMLAEAATRRWPHPIVVENRTGASGNIAAEFVARQPADGHTLLVVSNNMITMNPHVGPMPVDPLTELVPVAMLAQSPFILVAGPQSGVTDVASLIAAARARPGQVTYGSVGAGSPHHLAMAMLARMAGVEMTHVAYRGTPEALTDVAGGRLTAMASPFGPALPLIEGGRLRALAAAGATRLPWMPQLPTVAQSGLAGFDAGSWLALAAPRGTPAPVIAQLATFAQEVMHDPALKPALDRNALVPDTMNPADTLAVWRREHEAWGRVIREAGIQAG
jgi:tripartite-type tricarboxylate transporter receptor subunit TctC